MLKKFIIIQLLLLAFQLFSENRINQIAVPAGYKRIKYQNNSFSDWIQKLPIKNSNKIKKYDGTNIASFYSILAVIDKPILFNADLEQCADYCMRFWVDFHSEKQISDKLFLYNYSGDKYHFKKSNKSIINFLKYCMIYTNSHSLKMGCKKINTDQLVPGDMIVQNDTGGIGHVSMIMDVCQNKNGKKLFLIGYSFMPAQEFHIEKALSEYGKSGWFTIDGYFKYLKKYLDYGKPVLRRF